MMPMKPHEVYSIRKSMGLSLRGFARLLRIDSHETIRRWEKGMIDVPGPESILLEMIARNEIPERYQLYRQP